jgi:hypothetical protein
LRSFRSRAVKARACTVRTDGMTALRRPGFPAHRLHPIGATAVNAASVIRSGGVKNGPRTCRRPVLRCSLVRLRSYGGSAEGSDTGEHGDCRRHPHRSGPRRLSGPGALLPGEVLTMAVVKGTVPAAEFAGRPGRAYGPAGSRSSWAVPADTTGRRLSLQPYAARTRSRTGGRGGPCRP